MTDEPVLLSSRADGVLTLTLNRPHRRNAVDTALWEALHAALAAAGRDPDVRALVLTGAGGTFCSGADLRAGDDPRHPLDRMRAINEVALALHELPVPSVARVEGHAVGAGWNLALGCDLVVATPDARFAQIFAKRGMSVDLGGSWLLPRLVGMQQAKRLALLAETIDAAEAHALGLVTWVVEPDRLDGFVADVAARLAAGPPVALAQTKALLHEGSAGTLRDALASEARAQTINRATDAPAAGAAFRARVEPVFTGTWRAPRTATVPFPVPELRPVATGLRFPEGPVALSDGTVLVVEIRRGTLSRVDPATGAVTVVAETGGGPNGAAIGPDGAVYVCDCGGFAWHDADGITAPGGQPVDYTGGAIRRVELSGPRANTVTDLYREVDGRALRGPNDLVFDAHGGFWFTDLGKRRTRETDTGSLYYATPDGSSITEVVHPLTTPNGVGLSPDGTRLYVAETGPGRVWAWDVDGPGRLRGDPSSRGPGGATLLHGLAGHQSLDSLAVDAEGNVCVATLVTGAISVIAPDGALRAQVAPPVPDPFVTNICFAGAGSRTAWITSSGRGILYETTWPAEGIDLAFGA